MKHKRIVFILIVIVFSTYLRAVGQQSTVYASVVSTKLFVVGGANPQTGLFFQHPSDDTLWQHTGRNNIRAFGVAVSTPSKGQLICIASGNGVHTTTDGGATWKITTGWQITEVLGVVIDPRNAQVIYCCTPYGIWKTVDGGATWNEMNKGLASLFVSSVIVDHSNSNTVFCSTEDGAYRSDDGAVTWKRMGLSIGGIRVIAQHPVNKNILVVGTEDHGIYFSRDEGNVWEKSEAGLDHATFFTVTFDPNNPETMYAGGYQTGVYKSTDGGKSWKRANDGLTTLNVHCIAVDPTNSNRVYAATMWGGVFRSDNAGASWRNVGLGGSQVWTISIQPF